MGMNPLILYRCNCGRLLRKRDIEKGVCGGHQVSLAGEGSLLEWLKIKWWALRGEL